MHHSFTYRLLSAVGLSLLISCGYPAFNRVTSESTAQAQKPINQAPSSQDPSSQSDLSDPSDMTLSRLDSILNSESSDLQGDSGQWQLTVEDRTLIVLADPSSNRMRIFTPITSTENLSAQQIQVILLANFHTALDARYALSDNVLVSVFIHPLSSLTESDLRSALSQVATLANTFGSSYTSGVIDFGPSGPPTSGASGQLAI